MSAELIAILTIGVTLAGGQLATALWMAGRLADVSREVAEMRERMAKLEGLLEGLREAITGRRTSGDAA